jgi:hypothetical protein
MLTRKAIVQTKVFPIPKLGKLCDSAVLTKGTIYWGRTVFAEISMRSMISSEPDLSHLDRICLR